MIKRTAIVRIKAVRRRIVAIPATRVRGHCRPCGREVELLTVTQAAGILEADAEALDRLIEAERVHVTRTVNGNLRVCKDSLFLES